MKSLALTFVVLFGALSVAQAAEKATDNKPTEVAVEEVAVEEQAPAEQTK